MSVGTNSCEEYKEKNRKKEKSRHLYGLACILSLTHVKDCGCTACILPAMLERNQIA